MAINAKIFEQKRISVISSHDDAVGQIETATYTKYLKTLDESLLDLKEGVEPTRFILKGELDWQGSKALMNSALDIKGRDAKFNMGSILDEVKYSLVDIENGQGLDFKCGPDGYASEDLVAALHAVGIVMELWTALKSRGEKDSSTSHISKKK